MKNKSNKEIIEEFRKEFRPEYTGGGSIKNIIAYGKKLKSVKVDLSDVESFILQALEQKEREVIDKIKYHFETMVFDATVINVPKEASEQYIDKIMEFRREQSKYLSTLKSEGK